MNHVLDFILNEVDVDALAGRMVSDQNAFEGAFRDFDVCRAVEETAQRRHREFNLPGKFYVSQRVTQVYHTGVCIYFMYGVSAKGVENAEDIFGQIEHSLRQSILENGGSISHHHGVGKLRKDFMKDTLSPSSIELLKKIKQASDPKNVFGIRNNVFAE